MHAEILQNRNGFSVIGSVGFSNVIRLRLEGEKFLKNFSENCTVVIDLSQMNDHDASSFSLLLSWIRAAQKNKQMLSFLNIPHSMQRMQKMFGLNEALR